MSKKISAIALKEMITCSEKKSEVDVKISPLKENKANSMKRMISKQIYKNRYNNLQKNFNSAKKRERKKRRTVPHEVLQHSPTNIENKNTKSFNCRYQLKTPKITTKIAQD